MKRARLIVAIFLVTGFLTPAWSIESSETENECWQLLDQASEQLTKLSALLKTYRDASEKQDDVLAEAVRTAVDEATEPLLLRIADMDDQLRVARRGAVVAGVVGAAGGAVLGVLAVILLSRRMP